MDRRNAGRIENYAHVRTRDDVHSWIREQLDVSPESRAILSGIVDQMFVHYEGIWRASKEEALRAMAQGFTQRLNRMQDELEAREAVCSKIAEYFEHVVEDLNQRGHRDVKTQLLNFHHFMEHVQTCLAMARCGPWCAIGVVDITAFKTLNDTLGHAIGDRIIERVANLLRSEIRSSDSIAYQRADVQATPPLHARFGGDEFCFFLAGLEDASLASTIAGRFWRAVAQHDWSIEDERLATGAVNIDIGMVCLDPGPVSARHTKAREIANELFVHADECLYTVKRGAASHIAVESMRIEEGGLVELDAEAGAFIRAVRSRDSAGKTARAPRQ
jgi:diguanylate cyclase (GGDEF)-like protein